MTNVYTTTAFKPSTLIGCGTICADQLGKIRIVIRCTRADCLESAYGVGAEI
jgi:hypothetical protein